MISFVSESLFGADRRMGQGIGEGEGERLRPQFTPYWRSEARLDKGQ